MKHGKKIEDMYPLMKQENKVAYPSVSVPAACLEGKKYQPGDKVRVELVINIKHLSEYDVSGELIESEIESDADEKKEGEKVTTKTK